MPLSTSLSAVQQNTLDGDTQMVDRMARDDMPWLVAVPEAARLLGVGKTLAWQLVQSGELPSVRLGRRVLVPRMAVERLAHRLNAD